MPLRHRSACPEPMEFEYVGRSGDLLLACRSCAAFEVLAPASAQLQIPPYPNVVRTGWPTHKQRRRLRARRSK
jgi:hypothetical protein